MTFIELYIFSVKKKLTYNKFEKVNDCINF